MQFDAVANLVSGVPHIHERAARSLYEFVLESGVKQILELGFAHGASTAYMAAALDEGDGGHITTMDLYVAKERRPSLDEVLERAKLSRYVTPVYAEASYTWELMKLIERNTTEGGECTPLFDFAFIDGAHTWETDGLAFFLIDKLLRPGGWVLFDDLQWSFGSDPSLLENAFVREMPEEMRSTAQVGKIFALLVAQHPGFEHHRVDGNWGWARKREDPSRPAATPPEILDRVYGTTIRRDLELLARKVARRVLRR